MTERDYAPLSIACVRGLCDKMYEKRKFAGGEIEKMVKDFSDANNTSQIKRLIRVLGQDLMASTNPNVKNGALMGLSSVAVGLGQGCVSYLSELSHPIVACFSESESRVRYQAAEALFNVVKIARGAALAHFALLFEALARLAADPEPQVRQAAELLDRLLKDIVTESSEFDVSSFVPLLRERLYARGAPARQFAASWVSVLDAVPGARLLEHLPDLLDGLLHMLDDNNQEIRRMVDVQLSEFLRSIRLSPARADLPAMLNILITHAQAPEELLQLTALTWLKQFVSLGGAAMLPHASGALAAALPALAYTDEQRRGIRDMAATVNLQLIKLVTEQPPAAAPPVEAAGAEAEAPAPAAPSDRLNVPCVVGVVTGMLRHHSLHTKVAALDWILHLYSKMTAEMCTETEVVFVCCVGCLTDAADDVVRRALAVLAEICSCTRQTGELDSSPYYYRLLRALVRMLAADEALLEDRGAFIVRQLCVLLNAEDVYRALSAILEGERELRFAATAVDVLSTILLTAAELYHLRQQLRSRHSKAWRPLFARLFPCWCHSPVALLALCLLTHNYTLCQALIATFGDLEITVDFLTEVDKLVQLIESPIFAYLRLELLSGEQSGALRGALYGLLMLLPQSDAFHTLRTRLQCAPPPPPTPLPPHTQGEAGAGAGAESGEELSISALVAQFERVQAAHRRYRMMERTRPAPAAPASAPAAPASHHTAADKHYS